MNYKQTDFMTLGAGCFPGLVGVEIIAVEDKFASARMAITPTHFAPNGYVHAGSMITLADTIAGYGCLYNLPVNGTSFTTIELKTNFINAAKSGHLVAEASLKHSGRTTQLWDVDIKHEESGKTIALFRCTQLILYSGS